MGRHRSILVLLGILVILALVLAATTGPKKVMHKQVAEETALQPAQDLSGATGGDVKPPKVVKRVTWLPMPLPPNNPYVPKVKQQQQ